MAYIAPCDLIARYGEAEVRELSDRERPPLGEVDAVVCQRAIDDACALIDRTVGRRYAVPLAATPAGPLPVDVARIASDVARYYLHDVAAPDQVRKHYEDALRWLEQVGKGTLDLVATDGTLWPTKDAAQQSADSATLPYAPAAVFGDAFADRMDPSIGYATGTYRGLAGGLGGPY